MPRCSRPVLFVWLALAAMGTAGSGARTAAAQPVRSGAVRGQVVDAETGETLPGAHVFFSTTTRGTATDADGHFSFPQGAPAGAQRIHASMMGYEAQTLDTLLHAGRPYRLRLALSPTVLDGGTVRVDARREDGWKTQGDDGWAGLLKKFERLFVGEAPEADSVTLTNPEVLAFDPSWWGHLKADAGRPLIFENRALGYRLRYHLRVFEGSATRVQWDGEPFFEPLVPADSTEADRWRRNRRRAFRGSLRHFLLALLGDSLRTAGFRIHREPSADAFGAPRATRSFRVSAQRLLDHPPAAARDTLPAGTRRLDFRGRLRIVYDDEPEDPTFVRSRHTRRRAPSSSQRSYLELDGDPVHVDPAGEIIEPYGATLFGYFAFERLAALLPKEYRPDDDPASDAAP